MSLRRVGFITLPPGAKSGFDHADVDRARRRMYVAHAGADRIDVLDCERRTFLHSLPDLPGVAGVLVEEEHDLLFSSDRAAARVSIFRLSDEEPLGQVVVGPTRTASPTTAAGTGCTPSTSASRSARTAPPQSLTSTRCGSSPSCRFPAVRAGPFTTRNATSSTPTSASRRRSSSSKANGR